MNPYAALRNTLGRPLFIPFAVLGDGGRTVSEQVLRAYLDNGADALEVGMPFSDPTADGPVIQAADKRALDAGISVDDCFAILRTVTKDRPVPVGMLVYYNLIFKRGAGNFYADCKRSGVTSVLVADLPLEHANDVADAARKHGIQPVFMVSEQTSDKRIERIAKVADGYLYLVSYLGVTGKNDGIDASGLKMLIARCRAKTDLPLCVGFGIHAPEHVKAVV
ncbi:MAG TPA: tryptophan synthase subunit alpha, partial [Candidatus Peribacteria bacterium]|nr:tryptophan synthase subunit alpha [Candidatus Peribacteria bacterium]